MKTSTRILMDILNKTGAKLIRPRFVNELKGISKTHRVNFQIRSPEGVNRLPSSFFIVEFPTSENPSRNISGLFEYAYGAIRLVAINDEELARKDGDGIIAFFEALLQKNTSTTIHIYESPAGF